MRIGRITERSGCRAGSPETRPPHRSQACTAFDAELGNVVMYGGIDGLNDVTLYDMWEWTTTDWRAIRAVRTPEHHADCALAYDETAGHLALFGGVSVSPMGNPPD